MSTDTEIVSIQLNAWPEVASRSRGQVAQPELQPSTTIADDENAIGIDYQQLHPVDGGIAAWRLLCTAFVFEALLWGISSLPLCTLIFRY